MKRTMWITVTLILILSTLLVACQPQVVEKTVEKVVTAQVVVKETVEVEKEVGVVHIIFLLIY